MKLLRFLSVSLVLSSSLYIFTGCESNAGYDFIEGKVIEEFGDIHQLTKGRELFKDDSELLEKLKQTFYGFKVETNNGIYTVEIGRRASMGGSAGPQTAYNLAMAIKYGTKVRFPTRCDGTDLTGGPLGFSNSKIGILDPDDVHILKD